MGKWKLRNKFWRRNHKSRDKRRWKDNINTNLWERKNWAETFLVWFMLPLYCFCSSQRPPSCINYYVSVYQDQWLRTYRV